jgi:hypothetical protein
MKELKSKKTGRVSLYSDQEYDQIVRDARIDMRKFIVTDIKTRPVISAKIPDEVKQIHKKA